MSELTQLIMKNMIAGKIDKKTAAELIKKALESEGSKQYGDIAIIGINVKMPMADDLDEFWSNIRGGIDCISDFPESRKEDSERIILHNAVLDREEIKFIKGGYLGEIDKFDYKFFHLSPKEASLMDPNHRMFMQIAMGAIEDAGYGGKKLVGTNTGVFIGYSSWPIYGNYIMKTDPSLVSMSIPGNMSSIIAGRIPHLLDLKGPSMLIDTACSSSLVALHLACKSIKDGECEQAIVGGLKLNFMPAKGVYEIGIESKCNQTRAFDDGSDGTLWGEGAAVVIIKPLSKALEDRDNIYAVIKGTAANQDGASIGITAPNALAQEEVIVKAWNEAKVNPETISYIEAHGTGTKLGDPVEITGVQNAFRRFTDKKQFCAIGSVKTNIGHLDNAAGLAGLIKAALALKYKEIPPSIHFDRPNKGINFEQSPIYVNDKLQKWQSDSHPLRCGVSSFGFSGTNCHVVMEEAPALENEPLNNDELCVLALSTKSRESLNDYLTHLIKKVEQDKESDIRDICHTANTGRGHYEYRLAIIIKSKNELLQKLKTILKMNLEVEANQQKDILFGELKFISGNKIKRSDKEVNETDIREYTEQAEKHISSFMSSGKKELELLDKICKLYVSGADIEWELLYKGEKRRRVRIPAYPLERTRCWHTSSTAIVRNISVSQNLYQMADSNAVEFMRENDLKTYGILGSDDEVTNLKGKDEGDYSKEEVMIAKIWREVLGYSEFDINDSFFDIGGDSVLIMKVHAILDELYPGKTVVADMFAFPTISSLAKYLEPSVEEPFAHEQEKKDDVKTKGDIMDLFEKLEKGSLSFDEASEMVFDLGGKK